MTEAPTNLMVPTYPRSVQPGIPRLSAAPEGWSTRRFGELLKVVQRPVRMTDDGEYDLVTVKRSRGGIESRGRFRGKNISVKSQFALEGGDFLISKRQIVHGACAVVPEEFAGSIVSNEYSVLRCKPGLDLGFLRYLSHSVYFQQTCFHSSIGVHVEKMIFKLEDWLKFRVNVPPLEEQKRIAAGFEAVDAKLAALREKAGGLNHFKTGLMQRLFSQELRFTRENGTDFPDWEERKLGELFGWVRTNSLSREHLTDDDTSGVQNIHYGDIHSKFRAIFRQTQEEVPFITINAPLRTILDDDFVRQGDVVIADASEDYADIGKAIEVMEVRERSMVAGLHTFIARPDQGVLAPGFAGYMLRSAPLRRQIVRAAQGVSVLGLSKGNLEKLTLGLPAHEEQEKIAGALMAVDAKIDAVTDQITHMETFKKGLLQKMFV